MQNEKRNLVQVLYSVKKSRQKIYFLNAKQEVNGISYEELVNEAKTCLIKYQQQGLQAKDYVLIQVRDEKKFFITYWACLMGGMIPVLLPFINNKNEFYRLFNVWQQIQQAWLITDDIKYQQKLEQYATKINEPILEDILKKLVNPFELPKCEGELSEYKLDEQDIALILYSSGSTGEPKGAILTHGSILANMRSFISALHLGKEDVSLNWLPNTHIFGLIGFHFIPMFLDINQYQMTTNLFTLNPQLWLSSVNKYRATYLATSNTGLKIFRGI
ncbi:AMP-binding protein [Cellulosilyticum ruminicola]|uniref:AMP-binding protein n=1 Tax=Cellulosilyticum ruminicola TaxID=425254 RepID=UPI0006CFF869|nr:AMP-binding protein [Cellulosilyticum ruminicola]